MSRRTIGWLILIVSATVVVGLGVGFATQSGSTARASAQAPDGFVVPIEPIRVFDSRTTASPLATSPNGSETVIDLFGSLAASTDVIAAFANVTVVDPGANGYATIHPTGRSRPNTSSSNFARGTTVATSTLIARGPVGTTTVTMVTPEANATAHVIIDVFALVTSDPTRIGTTVVRTVTPGRVHDTRSTTRLGAGEWRRIPIAGRSLDGSPDVVPSDGSVSAVAINITVVNTSSTSRSTWIATTPGTSLVNVDRGRLAANFALVPLESDGSIDVYNDSGSTDVIIDVWGYATNSGVSPSASGRIVVLDTPFRAIDSRPDPLGPGRAEPWSFVDFNDSLANSRAGLGEVSALIGNFTGTDLRRRYPGLSVETFLSTFPDGGSLPSTSNLNLVEGETKSNLGVYRLTNEAMSVYNDDGYVNYVLDVSAVIVD